MCVSSIGLAATGQSFEIHEWKGSGPDYLHVHYSDDEAWHVLEGTLTFRFVDRQIEASAGTTVFVPAGVPHTYFCGGRTNSVSHHFDAAIASTYRGITFDPA